MNFNKDVDRVINNSKTIALEYKSSEIEPEHLFLALIDDENFRAYQVLQEIEIRIPKIKKTIQETLIMKNQIEHIQLKDRKDKIQLSQEVTKILENCVNIIDEMNVKYVDTDVVLLSLLNTKNNILNDMFSKINEGEILKKIHKKVTGNMDWEENDESTTPNHEAITKSKNKKAKLIEQFGDDITKKAKDGDLDPVVGRKIEIKRISQILSRRKKNNPILIGEPGVGKSAIVEGLAQRIVDGGNVPNNIRNKRIFTLNMGALVAGTKYRGEFESRLRGIIKEIEETKNIILFIDEIHTIIGAGSAQGSLDASNMLKPALARGTFQCIGATTLEEYRKHIEKDGALERRFQKVVVEPTTTEETIKILKQLKSRYEDYHKVIYTSDAIEACVNLTDKYMNDRFMPDKAIDALDEAGAKVHVDSNSSQPKPISILENKIIEAENKKTDCVNEQQFEKAASWRDKERNLTEQLVKLKTEWNEKISEERETVNKEDIAEVVSMMTKIPLDAVDDDESNKLRTLGSKMKNIVIGQDDAVDKIVRSIKRNRIGIKDPNKPVGTFMFLGTTGVGKTYLAKVLAKELFGSEENLIRIDMSEYMEKHSVSKLIGAPPGYIGYDDGGELTEAIRRKPYSIVLLDEMEKAHTDVFNILLQVLDDGILTDSYGRRVNFKNSIIIMTSNTGSRQLKDFGTGMGFQTDSTSKNHQDKQNAVIDKELKKKFAPEFLNRIDELIMFNTLSKDNIYRIIDLEVKTTLNRLKEIGYIVNITKSLKDFLFEEGWDSNYGARPLKRAIQRYIEDILTDAILDSEIKIGEKISLRSKDGEVTIVHLNSKELPPKNETPLLEA